jgi:2-polyprenyl-3-methyl-5-hydroxy-6-metoxy-1,4-benzoquinol methylase
MIEPEREESELRAYLGADYDHARLVDYDGQLEREFAEIGDEQQLYRSSRAYLYNLTAFAMTRTKEPYLRDLMALLPPPARLLEFGCGIGSDGLVLLEQGYDVEFADFANPSTRYLRWRLRQRGLHAAVHEVGAVPGAFDAVFAFDVLEHVTDVFATLTELERCARLVVVNVLEPVPGETALHHALPVAELLRHASRNGLRHYRRYHGRSHLLAYAPGRRGAPRALLRLARERVLRGRSR